MTYPSGTVVGGRFVIEGPAGEGGTGVVYRAADRERGERVALKVFNESRVTNDQEARRLLELAHPNIVRCIAFGRADDGRDFLATEWLDGETLRMRLQRGPLSLTQTLGIARRVADGLAAAHAWGIVHRDVTPANVMLVRDDIKLLDFGLAVRGGAGNVAGTIGYASPEQARGERATARADVFSLGCVIYECIMGDKPFAGDSDVAVIARMLDRDTAHVAARLKAPDPLTRLLTRMLSSDPEVRPRDGAAVAAELGTLGIVDAAPSATPTSKARSSASVTNAESRATQVLVAKLDGEGEDRIASELELLGGHVERHEKHMVCAWSTESSAVERAVRAARAALAVRRFHARAKVAMVVAPSHVAGREAAIEALPDEPSILVDADTARLLGDRFVVRPEGDDLVLLRESTSPHSRTSLLGRETQCIGRDREIGLIVSMFDECRDEPDARVVWVMGAPGIGKTRVRDEVLARITGVAQNGPTVWSAQADPTRASVAFGVLADLVRSAAGIARDDDEALQRTALASRACARVAESERLRVIEFLSELLRLRIEAPSAQLRAAREEPMLMGDQVRRAASDLVLSELAEHALALVIEDLQWADAVSVRAISDIARMAHDKQLFVLLLGRPEAKDTAIRLVADRQPTGVSLGKLGTKAMEKLVAGALSCAPSDPRVADITLRAAGNPFFAEEIVRASRAGDTSPAAALAMVEARLMSVEPEARRVLRAASVFGQQCTSVEIAALHGDDASVQFVDAWCMWLVEREILTQAGTVWSFRHALVRDAAYAMLTDADRIAAHALAADMLEREARVPGSVIAEHWSRACQPARAARWLATAAGDALEANDLSACIELGERALATLGETGEHADLLVVLAEAYRWRGDYERAAKHARAALTFLSGDDARFFRAAAELATITGSVGPAAEFETAIRKLEVAPRDPGDAASIAWSRAAMQLLIRNDPRADGLLARAESAAKSDLARGRVEQTYAVRAGIRGELEELARHYEASFRALERAGDVRGACIQELNLASAFCELGQDTKARERLAHGRREAETRGLSSARALGHHLDGILLAREERIDEAISAQRHALETFRAQGNARMTGGVRSHLAELLLRCGRDDEALREATTSQDELTNVPAARARALAVLALIHIVRKDAAAALAASAEALAIAEKAGVESGESLVYAARADALALAGSPDVEATREQGKNRLRARAEAISDPALRATFLAVPENAMLARSG